VEASLRELVRLLAALSGRTLFVGQLGFALVFPVVLFGPLIGLHIDNPWLVAGLTLYGLIVALTIGGMALAMFVGIANDDRSKLAAALAMETH
jgi:hypothetical protein